MAVQVKQRIDFLSNHCVLNQSDEDAVRSEAVVIDATAEERSLGVDEPRRLAAIQVPAAREAKRMLRPIRKHLRQVRLIAVQDVHSEVRHILH